MEKNMGLSDRIIRVILSAIFVTLYLTNVITGTIGIVLIVLSVVFLLTSFISFCPIYKVFGWSTSRKKKHV